MSEMRQIASQNVSRMFLKMLVHYVDVCHIQGVTISADLTMVDKVHLGVLDITSAPLCGSPVTSQLKAGLSDGQRLQYVQLLSKSHLSAHSSHGCWRGLFVCMSVLTPGGRGR